MRRQTIPLALLILLAAASSANGQDAGQTGAAGTTGTVEEQVDGTPSFSEEVTVVAASRRRERVVDAPAAVTVVLAEEIERQSSHGQVPRLVEFTPGVELTQGGIYDFNLNVRGFNSSLNRRVLVLIDGRDPSLPFLGAQEWGTFSLPLHELESVELVRGPASALYGTDALNGVLNMTTKVPREHRGGRLELSGGELDTLGFDLSHAGELGGGWYYRLSGGARRSETFARSRDQDVEYEGLAPEPVPLVSDEVETAFGGVRFDKHFEHGASLSLEGGLGYADGLNFVTTAGRFQVFDSKRPWAGFRFATHNWTVSASHTGRDAPDLLQVSTGMKVIFDGGRTQVDVQGNKAVAHGAVQLVGGVSYNRTTIDTADDRGIQTVLFDKETENRVGIFGQLDWEVNDRLKAVVAARWDDSDRYDAELSPKAALVWSLSDRQRLRFTYNEAFQAPSTAEFFVQVQVANPVEDLAPIEEALAPLLGGVPLGFGSVPVLALGNTDLEVERVRTFELGYNATLGRKHFFTLDLYRSELEDFVSAFLPQVGTSLGRLNENFGPYRPPDELSPEAAAALLAALEANLPPDSFATLSNNVDGSPVFAFLSTTNIGEVETTGVELGLNSALSRRFRFQLSFSHFDFDVREEAAENPILPNAPENKASLGLTYTGSRFDTTLGVRWSEAFEWRGGLFMGSVPSYSVVNLTANYRLDDHWTIGVNVANLLDDEHYEIFGGDLLERRGLVHVSYSW